MFSHRIGFQAIVLLVCVAAVTAGCKDDKGAGSVDLSTPKSAASSFAKAMRAGDAAGMRAASIGTEEQYKLVESMGVVSKSMADLKAAAIAKYGAENAKAFRVAAEDDLVKDIENSEFKTEGDVATMVRKDGPREKDPMKLKKVDGNWKVDLSAIPASGGEQFAKMAPVMKQTADELVDEINAGKHPTAADAQKAMMTKMTAAMMQTMPTPPAP